MYRSVEGRWIARSSIIDAGRLKLRIASAEDIVAMKAVARPPRDIVDIESILDVHLDLDLDYIRQRLREFSSVLEMPEILDDSSDYFAVWRQGDQPRGLRFCPAKTGCSGFDRHMGTKVTREEPVGTAMRLWDQSAFEEDLGHDAPAPRGHSPRGAAGPGSPVTSSTLSASWPARTPSPSTQS